MSSKKEKKVPEFGRPLVPYFLESTDEKGEFVINEDLEMPNGTQVKQKEIFIPNGERSWNVREFKDGYFEYKPKFLDEVMQGKQDSLMLVDKDESHFNVNNKNTETFADASAQFRSPKRRNSQKQGDYHYQNYENMMNKNRSVSPQNGVQSSPNQQLASPPLSTPKKQQQGSNEYKTHSSSPPQQIRSKKSQDRQAQFAKKLATSYSVESSAPLVEPKVFSTTAPTMPALITPQFLLSNKPVQQTSPPKQLQPQQPFFAVTKMSPPRDAEPFDIVGTFDEDLQQPAVPMYPPPHVYPSPPPFPHQISPPHLPPFPHQIPPSHPPPPSFFPQPAAAPSVPVQPPTNTMTEQELLASMALPVNKSQAFFAGGSITASPQASMLPKPKFKT